MDEQPPLLQIEGVRKTFSGVIAVQDVSFSIAPGELVGVLGPNGAGKSTLFHLITGLLKPDHGAIRFDGRPITHLAPYQRAGLGVGLVFQTARLFAGMSVFDNIMSGQFLRTRCGMTASALRLPLHRRDEKNMRRATFDLLKRLDIEAVAEAEVSNLPFGLQRRVAVAQALGVGERLLLLDEPAAGLTGSERDDLRDVIAGLRDDGIAILLVEHDVRFVSDIANSLVVLDRGAVLASGPVELVLANPAVIEAYSGVGA